MNTEKPNQLTYEFAKKVLNSDPLASEEALMQAQYALIDYLAASFAGSKEVGVSKIISMFKEEGGNQTVPVIGHKLKVSTSQGALINGFIGHVLDFDDVHSEVRGHPSTVILPILIAAAADEDVTGKKFLASYVIGVEVMARLGKAIGKNHFVKGWHNTSTLGIIAAAVAAGYLKDFTALQIAKAIGFAATQSSGLRVQFGTETKPLHPGLAAQAAVRAVKFVEYGLDGTTSALDGDLSFFQVYGHGNKFAEPFLLEDWGQNWKIVNPGLWFKVYPFCSAAHHGAEAVTTLVAKYNIKPNNIKEIIVIFPSNGDAALIKKRPKNGEEGRFSIEYVIALAIKREPLTFSNFQNQPISEDMQKLIYKVQREYDDSIIPASNAVPSGRFTIVKIITKDNQIFEARVDCPKGSPEKPLTLTDLEMKLAQSVESEELSKKLLNEVGKLRDTKTLKSLLELL